jgi:hypothetical protein
MKQRDISKEWVLETLKYPSLQHSVSDIEEHYFSQINHAGFRCLKVVFNPKENRIITAYFDRNMRKKGCK